MIPLVVALLVTHEAITKAYLLVPFVLVCVVMFCIGMSFILSASMVFFRDTQFIWGVLSMIWMYATPLFYPESILPGKIRSVLQLNPMYHYVKFFRTILMDGVSPNLSEYVWCLGMSLIVLEIGLLIYKKTQGKFALFV
jgi:ABC-2 type transport system permease protein